MQDRPSIIEIQNASVVTGNGTRILDDISFSINPGEHTVILGPNGSGKTSLIHLITYRYRAYAGSQHEGLVKVFGRNQWDVFELRSKLGIVTPDLDQSFSRSRRGITGLETVLSGFYASEGLYAYQRISEVMRNQAVRALAHVEALHLKDRVVDEMSTGEVRRILIARALALDPEAMLLDEPTTGLDLVARHRLLETLRHLTGLNKTLVLVTHHVEEIIPEIRRVILIRGGKIFADGPKEQILNEDTLSRVLGAVLSVETRQDGFYAASVSFNRQNRDGVL